MVLDKYYARGFNVTIINGENEFNIAKFKEYLLPIVEKHRSVGGSIIRRLDHGDFVGLIYELLVFS